MEVGTEDAPWRLAWNMSAMMSGSAVRTPHFGFWAQRGAGSGGASTTGRARGGRGAPAGPPRRGGRSDAISSLLKQTNKLNKHDTRRGAPAVRAPDASLGGTEPRPPGEREWVIESSFSLARN